MRSHGIFSAWYFLMATCPVRWEIVSLTNDEVLAIYRNTMNPILPKTLIGMAHAYTMKHVPYAYSTIKYKCFRNAARNCCNSLVPGTAGPTPEHKSYSPHPSHTCPKNGHPCLQNLRSFKKLPGRPAFKRVGRAFMFGLQAAVPGYGTRDLSKAKFTINEATKNRAYGSPAEIVPASGIGLPFPDQTCIRPMLGKPMK